MIISAIAKVAGEAWGKYQARKTVKIERESELAAKRIDVEIARLEARARHYAAEIESESAYDLQVLRNRERSLADEALIALFCTIFALPFLDAIQSAILGRDLIGLADAVAQGWAAHGYNGAPWWFEFLMIGVAVSTLGLFRLFRLWRGNIGGAK